MKISPDSWPTLDLDAIPTTNFHVVPGHVRAEEETQGTVKILTWPAIMLFCFGLQLVMWCIALIMIKGKKLPEDQGDLKKKEIGTILILHHPSFLFLLGTIAFAVVSITQLPDMKGGSKIFDVEDITWKYDVGYVGFIFLAICVYAWMPAMVPDSYLFPNSAKIILGICAVCALIALICFIFPTTIDGFEHNYDWYGWTLLAAELLFVSLKWLTCQFLIGKNLSKGAKYGIHVAFALAIFACFVAACVMFGLYSGKIKDDFEILKGWGPADRLSTAAQLYLDAWILAAVAIWLFSFVSHSIYLLHHPDENQNPLKKEEENSENSPKKDEESSPQKEESQKKEASPKKAASPKKEAKKDEKSPKKDEESPKKDEENPEKEEESKNEESPKSDENSDQPPVSKHLAWSYWTPVVFSGIVALLAIVSFAMSFHKGPDV